MGFNLGRTYVLEFEEGTYLAGAEIRIRSTPISVVMQLEDGLTVQDQAKLLAEYVESWNLEVAGDALLISAEAILATMEYPVIKKIVREWYRAAVGISAPLDPPSGDGQPSPDTEVEERSIPMELPSGDPEN